MNKRILFVISILMAVQYAYGQTLPIEAEKWTDKPVISALDSKYNKESAVVLMDKRRFEFIDNAKQELEEYYTVHKIIHINDDKGIESFNKIYLGVSENSDIVDVKARTILPGGKTAELDRNNIKDIKEDNGNTYKIFAMEGLENGCEVEFYYTIKKPVSFFGREILQNSFPVVKSEFQLIVPQRLRFDVRPYNFSTKPSDTVINNKRFISCKISGIPGVEEEKYATYEANLERLEFKLSYNDVRQKDERLFTWNEFAKRIYGIYNSYSDKDNSKIAEVVSNNGWNNLSDETAKIIAIENFIKKTFSYNENQDDEDANKLENVIKNKITGTVGLMRLYSAIFKNVGINYQFVLSCDRNKVTIDKDFENWSNCDQPLLYFPTENKFLSPTRPDFRYPWIMPDWGSNNGLFCKQTSLGSFSTALAEIKTIPLEDYTKSHEDIDTHLKLNPGLDSLSIDNKEIYAGYAAVEYRDVFNYSNADETKKVLKGLAKNVCGTENIISSEIINPEFENGNTNTPLIIHVKTKSDELIEKAGNKLLIKIGLTIGPQTDMYQEKPRQEPVSVEYGHIEERKIEFIIPDGYTISNPDDLKISQTFIENGNMTMGFVSDYQINGNVLSVHIMEQYTKEFYPLSQFAQFKKIINASCDFNKVVLVLEKKS